MRDKRVFSSPRVRNLIGFSTLILILFCVIVAYQGSQAYKQALQDGEQDASRLARILSDHVELTFLGVDLSLRRAIERQYFNTLFGNNLPEYIEQNFKAWLDETPQIVAMAMVDEHGVIEVAAHKKNYEHWLDYSGSLVGDPLFEQMKDADDRALYIGRHLVNKTQPLIVLSRRFNKLGGEFGGVMVAAINPSYVTEFYKSIAFGVQKYMTVMRGDHTMLVSGPTQSETDLSVIDKVLSDTTRDRDPTLVYTSMKSADDSIKIVASKQLKNMPLVISVLLDEDDFLYEWRQSRLKDIGFLALFTIFAGVLSLFAIAMARQIFRVEESESAAILASQAKSEFLANMSHELRTPLNAIIGFSEMINSGYFGPLNAKQKERVHDINLCGTHLLQLISDILEFSKGDAGKLELVEEKVELPEIINEAVRMLGGKLKAKGIHLVASSDQELPNLWGDKRKIRQILLNLLTNAIKFTPEGGTIKVAARLDMHQSMHLLVSDTGVGIAEEDIPTALSVFGQVHRSKSHEGTGLGLPLCKMYAELHGGKLVLTSKVGEGTAVKIIFPHQRTLPRRRDNENEITTTV
jgi:signal transduction histidine kinase